MTRLEKADEINRIVEEIQKFKRLTEADVNEHGAYTSRAADLHLIDVLECASRVLQL